LATLVEETAWVMSHLRPEPAQVEVTRTALTLSTLYLSLIQDPRAVRSLLTLRRLPPAAPDSPIRALATVLSIGPAALRSDRSALDKLAESPEFLLAGIANAAVSYLREGDADLAGALGAARRMLAAFEDRATPWLLVMAHSRIGELCVQAEQGDEARRHLRVALLVLEELGVWSEAVGVRWGLVLANLQVGDVEEAERWWQRAARDQTDDGAPGFDLAVRAELALAKGELEVGLTGWRRAVERVKNTDSPLARLAPGVDPWALEVQSAAVIAHARQGRLDLVEDIVRDLPGKLSLMLASSAGKPLPSLTDLPVCGALLLALATVDLDRARRTGDPAATTSGVRMIALAERFRFLRNFQPTMSSTRARDMAEQADRPAYVNAVASYADLSRDELWVAAGVALRERAQS
jgi:hypothetical protein